MSAWPAKRRIESGMRKDLREQGWCLISRKEIDALLEGSDDSMSIPVSVSPDDHFGDVITEELDSEDEYHWIPAIQRTGNMIMVCCGHQISPSCDCKPVAEYVDFAVIYRHKPVV